MTGKNRYFRRSKISEAKFRQLLRLFSMDLTATDAAQLCGLSVRSVNAIYQRIRVRLVQECAAQFHGVRRDKFELHLKETEFRFNHRHLDLYKTLLALFRNEPL